MSRIIHILLLATVVILLILVISRMRLVNESLASAHTSATHVVEHDADRQLGQDTYGR